jgi:NAD(P)-dependent dehydrogenase (short-subunit alcohol dehydrogenase family)
MQERTVLVTGANTGIGFETAAGLVRMGAEVVITSRDTAKGAAAVEEIKRRHSDANVTAMHLDLARLDDVRRFAREFEERFPRLHVLVNNAGVALDRRSVTADGFETMFQVNHLGPFLLTNLLLERLKGSAPARIVNVATEAHRFSRLDFDDLQSERSFRGMRSYLRTKLCNMLFTHELARRLLGTGVTANSLHPGGRPVRTRIALDGDTHGLFAIGARISGPLLLSPAKGAETTVYLASSPDAEGRTGEYWVRRRPKRPSRAALDDESARRLWDVSAQLAGL